jgi:methylglutaconyl-CoA hydratase
MLLHVEVQNSVAKVTLNRPDVRNAFNDALIQELTAWAESVHPGGPLRAAVLSGAGKVFCAGADLAWMAKTITYSHEENIRDARALARMLESLNRLPIPLFARVHGAALGGGIGLAAVCDIVVAAEDAIFGFTEVKLGIVPAVISPFAIAKIGESAARELFLTGARFTAARAREIGLVHTVADAADLDRAVSKHLNDLASSGPRAVAAAKALIASVVSSDADAAAEHSIEAIARQRVSAEGQEGMRAFLEKRTPAWITQP